MTELLSGTVKYTMPAAGSIAKDLIGGSSVPAKIVAPLDTSTTVNAEPLAVTANALFKFGLTSAPVPSCAGVKRLRLRVEDAYCDAAVEVEPAKEFAEAPLPYDAATTLFCAVLGSKYGDELAKTTARVDRSGNPRDQVAFV